MSLPVTGLELVRAVREIAAERPTNRYLAGSACYYNQGECTDGTCGCLIGQALRRVGVCEKLLDKVDSLVQDEVSDAAVDSLLLDDLAGVVKSTDLQRHWLRTVQAKQDSGFTWKQAILAADTEVGL